MKLNLEMGTLVGGKYIISKRLGSGAFGEIYHGVDSTTEIEYAIKFEPAKARHPQLFYEYKLYDILKGGLGIPKVYDYVREGEYNILVMELLGESLEQLLKKCQNKFSLKTVLMIADQLIDRIEYMHKKDFLHRDVKPDNFLVGVGKNAHILHVIDLGLAKRYKDLKTGKHIPYRDDKKLTGTARYTSIKTHLGVEQSRRDDLESLGYVLMYLNMGTLPWQGMKAKNKKEKYDKIKDLKVAISFETLCKGYPNEFQAFFEYCHKLHFEEPPDYDYLKRLLLNLFVRNKFKMDFMYDWVGLPISALPLSPPEKGKEEEEKKEVKKKSPLPKETKETKESVRALIPNGIVHKPHPDIKPVFLSSKK